MLTEYQLYVKRAKRELARKHVAKMIARHGPRHIRKQQGKQVELVAKMEFDKGSISIAPCKAVSAPKQGFFNKMSCWISGKRG